MASSPTRMSTGEPSSKKAKLTTEEEAVNQDIAEAIIAAASAAVTAVVDDAVTAKIEDSVNSNDIEHEPPAVVAPEVEDAVSTSVVEDVVEAVVEAALVEGIENSVENTISSFVPDMDAPAAELSGIDATPTDPAATGTITEPDEPAFIPRIPPSHYITGIQPTTKHDEKWNEMFYKLQDYKQEHGHTLVPQNYKPDIKLGRWVHYQRVEYWLYQQRGQGKITISRIKVLEQAGFEWDPQRAQWNALYERLAAFKRMHSHCQVPKGFKLDKELANWVRNQRLEYTNKLRGKKNRMTEDRQVRLEALGFKWSAAISVLGTASPSAEGDVVMETTTTIKEEEDGKVNVDETVTSQSEVTQEESHTMVSEAKQETAQEPIQEVLQETTNVMDLEMTPATQDSIMTAVAQDIVKDEEPTSNTEIEV